MRPTCCCCWGGGVGSGKREISLEVEVPDTYTLRARFTWEEPIDREVTGDNDNEKTPG